MSQRIPTIEEAEAIFIKSLAHLVSVLGLTIVVAGVLTIYGYALPESTIHSVARIMITMIWMVFLFKILRIVEKYVNADVENRKLAARYVRT
ncbi:MAG: hypothetical protein ACXAE3_10840 [Candidatus Kariarchaeaceae archaeon]|jgi:hypothetical protein